MNVHRRPVALLAFAILTIARAPRLWLYPRLHAEEGSVYFRYALDHGWWDCIRSLHVGYYAFVPNVATKLAASVPLTIAPFVTMLVAAAVQALVALIVIDDDAWVPNGRDKLLVLLALVLPAATWEVWLTTIGSQFWLATACAFAMVSKPRTWMGRTSAIASVMLGALTGLGPPLVALPMMAYGFVVRSRARVVGGIALACGGLLQIAVASRRPLDPSPVLRALGLFLKLFVVPCVGGASATIGDRLRTIGASPVGPWIAIAALLVMGLVSVAIHRRVAREMRWLLWTGLWVSAAGSLGALDPPAAFLDPDAGVRYVLVGAIALYATLFFALRRAPAGRVVFASLVAIGAFNVVSRGVVDAREGDNWRADARTIESDRGHTLRLKGERCRLGVHVGALRADFAVERSVDPNGSLVLGVRAASVDVGREGAYFVFHDAPSFDVRLRMYDGVQFVASRAYVFGEGAYDTPGHCWDSPSLQETFVAAAHGPLRLHHELRIPRDAWSTVPPGVPLYVGYGRDAGDALAKGTVARIERP